MITTVEYTEQRTLVIRHLCGNGKGCDEHPPGTWRTRSVLPVGTSQEEAQERLAAVRAEAPKSTYRLVEVLRVHSVTEKWL